MREPAACQPAQRSSGPGKNRPSVSGSPTSVQRHVHPGEERGVARVAPQAPEKRIDLDVDETAVALIARPLQPRQREVLLSPPAVDLGDLVGAGMRESGNHLVEGSLRLARMAERMLCQGGAREAEDLVGRARG